MAEKAPEVVEEVIEEAPEVVEEVIEEAPETPDVEAASDDGEADKSEE